MSGGGGGAPARYVSVSELYSADEVELLLEEIRELEPTSCRGEDLADCEIAGSGAARSPAPTERSWDSHAHYARAPPLPADRAVPLHCRLAYLLERDGLLTLLIIVLGLSCAGCVWAVAGLRGRVPGARARLLLLGGFSSALLHSALFVLHLTHLTQVLPLRWDKLAMWTGLWSGGAQLGGALSLLSALLFSDEYQRAAPQPRALLYSAVGVGLAGAGLCLWVAGGVLAACVAAARARAVPGAAYRAVPAPPPPAHDDRL